MADEPDKRCGTCRYWGLGYLDAKERGSCDVPLPHSLPYRERDRGSMRPNWGRNCPVWQAKDKAVKS